MTGFIASDTSVIAHLTKVSRHSSTYLRFLGSGHLAVSFQTVAEILAADYAAARRRRLDFLMRSALHLSHSNATSRWYAETSRVRRALKAGREKGGDAGDADMWIISSALEHGIHLMSHDGQQVALGRAMRLAVYTALPGYRASNPA